MQIPLQIDFRGVDGTSEAEALIREKATKLDRYQRRIVSIRVMVEMPHKHHKAGNQYRIKLEIHIPGDVIVVDRESARNVNYEQLGPAVRDVFETASRLLEEHQTRSKNRSAAENSKPLHAKVVRLFPDQGYGFIQSLDGREIYFHENSVVNSSFDQLKEGIEVRFAEEEGNKGPQASSVHIVG